METTTRIEPKTMNSYDYMVMLFTALVYLMRSIGVTNITVRVDEFEFVVKAAEVK